MEQSACRSQCLPLLCKWQCRCQNEVTCLGKIVTAVKSARKELLLASKKLDTEHSKKAKSLLNWTRGWAAFVSEELLTFLIFWLQVFQKPMADSGCLTEGEMGLIFVNWKELIMSNTKLLKWVLLAFLCFPLHLYSLFPFPRKFSGFTVNISVLAHYFLCMCAFRTAKCIQTTSQRRSCCKREGANKQQEQMHICCNTLEMEPTQKHMHGRRSSQFSAKQPSIL